MAPTLSRSTKTALRKIAAASGFLLRVLIPPVCLFCEEITYGEPLCQNCKPFQKITRPFCESCGEPTPTEIRKCGRCRKRRRNPLSKVRSALWLTEPTLDLLHQVKYQGRYEWLEFCLKQIDVMECFEKLPEKTVLVPVPLSPQRYTQRGYNQSEILAHTLSKRLSLPLETRALLKIRETPPQSTLGSKARMENLKGSFQWVERPVPNSVLLIDDVSTTGSTLRTCAITLRQAGGTQIFGWTLFRAGKLMLSSRSRKNGIADGIFCSSCS